MSGVVPQVAAMVGPGAAGTAYIPGLADYVPMVKSDRLAGARRAGAGQGGDRAGDRRAGARRLEGPLRGERRRRRRVRERRGVPRGGEEVPLVPSRRTATSRRPDLPCTDPDRPARRGAARPPARSRTRKPYDMYKLIRAVVDHGEIFDIKPRFARSIITCFARIGGQSVGVVANQPMHLGGILDNDSADKAAHFIQICDAFNVPLVFLQDVPGFMVGSKVEHAGIIRHGAKMLHVMSAATVPKLTVVVRKAYGAGYYVMCGRAYEPDLHRQLADRRDQRDGRRGHGRHRRAQALRRRGAAARGEEEHRRDDPEEHRHLQVGRAGGSSTRSSTRATRAASSPGASSSRGTSRSSGRGGSAASFPCRGPRGSQRIRTERPSATARAVRARASTTGKERRRPRASTAAARGAVAGAGGA